MKRGWIVLVVCGCNRILGIGTTSVDNAADARFFDAGVDAPPACPPIGTPPAFKDTLHQLDTKLCIDYVPAEDASFAMALCNNTVVETGPPPGPLAPVSFNIAPGTITSVRLSPEGDLALVESYMGNPSAIQSIDVYARGATPALWTHVGTLPLTSSSYMYVSTPTRGPSRHVFVIEFQTQVYELVGDGDSWNVVDNYNLESIGANVIGGVSLTSDGLRMVWRGLAGSMSGVLYADRADVASRFATTTMLDVPDLDEPYLTADCNRLYFNAISTTLYFQQ